MQVCKEVQESHGKMLKDWIKGIQGGFGVSLNPGNKCGRHNGDYCTVCCNAGLGVFGPRDTLA